ncbi:short-chain dehydrogenase/reductase SDR, partial [Reticulomyxa filosa]
MSRKRSLDEKEGEPAKKKSKLVLTFVLDYVPEHNTLKRDVSLMFFFEIVTQSKRAFFRLIGCDLSFIMGRMFSLNQSKKKVSYKKKLLLKGFLPKTFDSSKNAHEQKEARKREKRKRSYSAIHKLKIAMSKIENCLLLFTYTLALYPIKQKGIGQAIAIRLVKEGAIVYILDKKKWKETEKICAQSVLRKDQVVGEGMKCDVTDAKELKKCVDSIVQKHGYVDVLVNAAVLHDGEPTPVEKIKAADLAKVIDTNFVGALNACQIILPYMKQERGTLKSDAGDGNKIENKCELLYDDSVVNIVSMAGLKANDGQVLSASGAGALVAATKAIAKEYAKTGVTVNCVALSYFESDDPDTNATITKAALTETAIGRPAELAEIAGIVAWAACEENSYTTGFVYDCTGGYTWSRFNLLLKFTFSVLNVQYKQKTIKALHVSEAEVINSILIFDMSEFNMFKFFQKNLLKL